MPPSLASDPTTSLEYTLAIREPDPYDLHAFPTEVPAGTMTHLTSHSTESPTISALPSTTWPGTEHNATKTHAPPEPELWNTMRQSGPRPLWPSELLHGGKRNETSTAYSLASGTPQDSHTLRQSVGEPSTSNYVMPDTLRSSSEEDSESEDELSSSDDAESMPRD